MTIFVVFIILGVLGVHLRKIMLLLAEHKLVNAYTVKSLIHLSIFFLSYISDYLGNLYKSSIYTKRILRYYIT